MNRENFLRIRAIETQSGAAQRNEMLSVRMQSTQGRGEQIKAEQSRAEQRAHGLGDREIRELLSDMIAKCLHQARDQWEFCEAMQRDETRRYAIIYYIILYYYLI